MFGSATSFRRSRRIALIALTVVVQCAVFFSSQTALRAQDDQQPYMVYVDQEGVTARCGPGGEYYRTDPLRHGQALEVYVEAEDGWLGIRPPEGSFCWLPSDAVKLSPSQDFGIVDEENSLAWIGTHLGKANKYLWQVQLSKGEEVAILGRAQREGPDGQPKLWYRIVPPAGEFRWVHRDQVVENPEMLIRDKPQPNSRLATGEPTLAPEQDFVTEATTRPTTRPTTRSTQMQLPKPPVDREASYSQNQNQDRDQDEVISGASVLQIVGSGVNEAVNAIAAANYEEVARAYEAPLVAFTTRPTMRSIGETGSSPDNPKVPTQELVDAFDSRTALRSSSVNNQPLPTSRPHLQNQSSSPQQMIVDQSRVLVPASVVAVSNTVKVPRADDRSVDALQLELSRLMSRSAPAIDVEPVLVAAETQSQAGKSESERQRASMIVERARQYQQVASRRDRNSLDALGTTSAPRAYPEPVRTGAVSPVTSIEAVGTEMVGYLVQVFSSRPDSPPFALTDKEGRTTLYVSPAPGVNLRRNLNQYVTVRGSAGYTTGLDTPHVIASGVVRTLER